MNNIHDYLIESLFFQYIDRAVSPEETPLWKGMLNDGKPLSEVIAMRFGLNPSAAEAAIEAARQEVIL